MELKEFIAALILGIDELAGGHGPRPRAGRRIRGEGQLLAIAERRIDPVNLRRIRKAGRDQHPATGQKIQKRRAADRGILAETRLQGCGDQWRAIEHQLPFPPATTSGRRHGRNHRRGGDGGRGDDNAFLHGGPLRDLLLFLLFLDHLGLRRRGRLRFSRPVPHRNRHERNHAGDQQQGQKALQVGALMSSGPGGRRWTARTQTNQSRDLARRRRATPRH